MPCACAACWITVHLGAVSKLCHSPTHTRLTAQESVRTSGQGSLDTFRSTLHRLHSWPWTRLGLECRHLRSQKSKYSPWKIEQPALGISRFNQPWIQKRICHPRLRIWENNVFNPRLVKPRCWGPTIYWKNCAKVDSCSSNPGCSRVTCISTEFVGLKRGYLHSSKWLSPDVIPALCF